MNVLISKLYINGLLRLSCFLKDQKGVTAIEYSMIGVAMATLLAFILGDQNSGFLGAIREAFDNIEHAISDVTISE
jgi:Flp/Fap pilin component.